MNKIAKWAAPSFVVTALFFLMWFVTGTNAERDAIQDVVPRAYGRFALGGAIVGFWACSIYYVARWWADTTTKYRWFCFVSLIVTILFPPLGLLITIPFKVFIDKKGAVSLPPENPQKKPKSSRMNGWKRIGVVLSILWILGATSKLSVDAVNEAAYQEFLLRQYPRPGEAVMGPHLDPDALLFVFGAVPLGWFCAYIGIWVFRWVRAGYIKD